MADDPTMTTQPTCSTCRFFHRFAHNGTSCHRWPPTPVLLEGQSEPDSVWPTVTGDDWCGEQEPVPAPATVQKTPVAPCEASGDVWVVIGKQPGWRPNLSLDESLTYEFAERTVIAETRGEAASAFASNNPGWPILSVRRLKILGDLPVLIVPKKGLHQSG